tara:strand:- start:238 stop:426 length:189 start_codon:yes stop_codon:yes gene_type:complete
MNEEGYYATYKHGEHWYVSVYKINNKFHLYMQGKEEEQSPLHIFDEMPTWEETKWFYDHLNG